MRQRDTSLRRIAQTFRRLHDAEAELLYPTVAWQDPSRDGFRHLAVNPCHLVPGVQCCARCGKNAARHKAPIVEFRGFDLEVRCCTSGVISFAWVHSNVEVMTHNELSDWCVLLGGATCRGSPALGPGMHSCAKLHS